jgi:hypothetical protein
MEGITLSDLEEYEKVRELPLLPLPWAEWYFMVMGELHEEETHDFRWLRFALAYKPTPIIRYVRTPYPFWWRL